MRASVVRAAIIGLALTTATACSPPRPEPSPPSPSVTATSCAATEPSLAKAADVPLPAALRTATFEPVTNADASVAYLMETYGLSKKDADERLTLQRESEPLNRWLLARYPNALGEMRLDPAAGTIIVPTTDADALTADLELAAYAHRSAVVIEPVAWSRRTTEAIDYCLRSRIPATDPEVQFGVQFDLQAGRIWLEAADTDVGRAFLNTDPVRLEVQLGGGLIDTRTHPRYEPGGKPAG